MSLFKTRDWWSTTCGNDEEFDQGCLCVANIDNSLEDLEKIIVGSFSGMLRVFSTHATPVDNGRLQPPGADSLLLEAQLSTSILHVAAGRFVSSSGSLHLCVLHPRKLSIYSISAISGNVEFGNHYHLGLMYEHNLQRSGFRLVTGPFGKVKGRDFMCVLSLDGTMSIFEQESFAFSRFLPGALLPGPLAYVAYTDSFVTVSSSYILESYKYQVLAVATSTDTTESQNMRTGKKVTMDWFYNLGEQALDVTVVQPQNRPPVVYVLGEHHLFCIQDTGALKFMKKLEFPPSSFHAYIHGSETTIFLLVASHTNMLMVFQDVTLKWASQLTFVPVAVHRTNFRGLEGAIVLLSDNGQLTCSYLGTNPSIFTPPAIESREVNYRETDKELAELYKIIHASQKSGTSITKHCNNSLAISATIPKEVKIPPAPDGEECRLAPSINLKVQLRSVLPLENIQLMCYFEKSFIASPAVFHFPSMSDTAEASVSISLSNGYVPSTLVGTIAAVASNASGPPCIVRSKINLPLVLVVTSCQPQKDADFKVTIGSQKAVARLDDLFPEFFDKNQKGNGQALGLQYYCEGPVVTILVAKTSQRYRLQSDCFGALYPIAEELESRLGTWYSRDSKVQDDNTICVYSNPLPVLEFCYTVNKHLQNRHKMRSFEKRLSQLAAQFRSIQKRLLVKFKEKTTTPIANFDVLLESTNEQIISTAKSMEEHRRETERSLTELNGASRFLCFLMKLYANVKPTEYDLMLSALCPPLEEETEQGWEEVVANNVAFLLETTFLQPGQEPLSRSEPMSLPDDIGFLKKCLTMLVDRLGKGTSQEDSVKETFEEEDEIKTEMNTNDDVEDGVPLGSTFGEKKSVRFSEQARPQQNESRRDSNGTRGVNKQVPSLIIPSHDEDLIQEVPLSEPLKTEDDGDNLPDIYTVAYDTQSLHGEF